jgi:hypothetical protein
MGHISTRTFTAPKVSRSSSSARLGAVLTNARLGPAATPTPTACSSSNRSPQGRQPACAAGRCAAPQDGWAQFIMQVHDLAVGLLQVLQQMPALALQPLHCLCQRGCGVGNTHVGGMGWQQ